MNKLLIIVFVAVTVNGQDKILEPLANLPLLRERVEKALNDLEEYNNQSTSFTKNYVGDLETSQLQAINSVVDQLVSDTRNNIAAAKSTGKNVHHCYSLMRNQSADAIELVIHDLNKCVEDEETSDFDIVWRKYLLFQLKEITNTCQDEDQVQLCVARKLPKMNLSVHTFEFTVQEIKTKGEFLTTVESVQRCFLQPKTVFDSAISAARTLVAQCIQNA